VLLSQWWGMAGTARAASYPPALGCGVSGLASAGSGVLSVRGVGFAAGSRVLVSVAGRSTGAVRADAAGSFQASWFEPSWQVGTPAAGATVAASAVECSATGPLAIEIPPEPSSDSPLLPTVPSRGSGSGQPGQHSQPGPTVPATPAQQPGTRPSAGPTRPEPVPPPRRPEPAVAAIPSVPLTGLPPQLFLGLAGAVLLGGAALTGLTGRLGHRRNRSNSSGISVASSHPMEPGTA
jgi:hypothetical protein